MPVITSNKDGLIAVYKKLVFLKNKNMKKTLPAWIDQALPRFDGDSHALKEVVAREANSGFANKVFMSMS